MLIGIDASRLAVEQPTGTERYALQVIRHLQRADPRQPLVLYFNRLPAPGLLERAEHVTWRALPAGRLWTHLRLSREMLRHPPNALFVPAHVVPLAHPPATVVTIHDLGYRFFGAAHGLRRRLELELTTRFSARAARLIVVPSQATRRDLEREYGVAPGRIRVVPHGVDADLVPLCDPARLAAVQARYAIRPPYVLFVGTLHPRKNVARLLDAFLRCRARVGDELSLVLVGQPGWRTATFARQLAAAEAAGAVRRLGYVARQDLGPLYSGALAVALPSLYEGFGLPVLEAMACGAAVVASSTSALPEVVGESGLLVDPRDVAAIAAALELLARDADLRRRLAASGLERARHFTWERCARETLRVIREVAVL